MSERKAIVALTPGECYTAEDLANIAKLQHLHLAQADRAATNDHFHFVSEVRDQDHVFDFAVFIECGTGSILHLALEGRTLICNRYDNFRHAMDSKPLLRGMFAALRQLAADNPQWFSDHISGSPEADNTRREQMGI